MSDEIRWLIARELPRLRRYARALRRDVAAADDLVQDCVERALRKRHQWQRHGSLKGWLLRMMYRLHLNGLRGRRASVALDDVAEGEAQMSEPPRQLRRVELREMAEALERLPGEQRDTLTLVALEGLSYDEAAAVMAVPVGTVRSRLSRARTALAELREGRRAHRHLRRVK